MVLAGALEIDGKDEEETTEVWKVVGEEESGIEGAGFVIWAKDDAGRMMERKRSVEESGSDRGH